MGNIASAIPATSISDIFGHYCWEPIVRRKWCQEIDSGLRVAQSGGMRSAVSGAYRPVLIGRLYDEADT